MFNMRLDHLLKMTMMLTHVLFTHTSIHAHLDEQPDGTNQSEEKQIGALVQPLLNIEENAPLEEYAKALVDCEDRILQHAEELGCPVATPVSYEQLFQEAKATVHEHNPEIPLEMFDVMLEYVKAERAKRLEK